MEFYIQQTCLGIIQDDQVIPLPLFDLNPKSVCHNKVGTEYILTGPVMYSSGSLNLTEEEMHIINNAGDVCSEIKLSIAKIDLYHEKINILDGT